MNRYRHHDVSFALPSDWQDASQILALGPADGGFRPNLVVNRDALVSGEDAKGFATRQLPAIKKALGKYVLVKEGPATFGTLSGFLREQTFTAEGRKLGQLQFFVASGGSALTFTFTHLQDKLHAAGKTAEQLFAGVKLEGAAPAGRGESSFGP